MRQVKLLLALLLLVLVAASCKSVSYLSRGIDIHLKDANQSSLSAELKVDLNKKVTATSDMQDSKNEAIVHAYYKCITTNDIDVVVDPIVKITRYSTFTSSYIKGAENAKWWKPQFKAEINGYGGKYVKIETDVEQAKKFDNVDMNSVIKYKIISDPEFYKSYYNKKSNNIFLNTNTVEPAKPSPKKTLSQTELKPMASAPKVQNISYSDVMAKGKAIRKAGIALTVIGTALLAPIGGTLYSIEEYHSYQSYNYDYYGYSYPTTSYYWYRPYDVAGICCMGIGAGLFAAGIGCLIEGSIKVKKAKQHDMKLSFNFSPNSAYFALNF